MDPAATLLAAADAAFARGDLAAAEAGYRSAIARFGARGEWLANLGAILIRGQRTADALPALEAAAVALPDNAAVLAMQGYALLESGRRADALAALERALARDPQRLDAWNNLGRAHAAGGDFAAAAAAWERALAISPRYTPALSNWCDALIARGDVDSARDLAGRYATAAPDDAGAGFKHGYALMLGTDLDAARAALDRVATIDPRFPLAHHNLGTIALWQNRIEDADRHFRAELDRDPGHADARFGLASALLKRRRCDEGWREFESRVGTSHGKTTGLPPTVPAWDGAALAGTLLVLAEEGLGDVLQFARFVADARKRLSRVVLYCDGYWAPLSRLLATAPGVDALVDRSSGSLPIAAHARIMSLPRILAQGVRAMEPRGAYLTPPAADVARWAERLRPHPGFRVGLCWGGNPRVDLPHAARIDERRSIGLARLAPLVAIPGVQFVSLQKGGAPDRALASSFRLVDWSEEFTDYADTAALMANLDLVLTVDTSIVHCAGAVGRPVWMLDRFDNCWRWGTDPANPGWYTTLRVFRQRAFGDWAPVVDAVAHALAPLAQANAAARTTGG
jgi:tetratricopeptide (TPR) repeat protein